MMYKIFSNILIGITVIIAISSCEEKLDTSYYSSYTASELSNSTLIYKNSKYYDSLIINSLHKIGLDNPDIEIRTVPDFGAYSVINVNNNRRYILYSVAFFDSVQAVTKSQKSVTSICLHEIAHHFYGHPLKSKVNSVIYERHADRYSGYQMCILGASLDEAQLAMKYFGNDKESKTHPSKADRLDEIKRGYVRAKIEIFKDTNYLKVDSALRVQEYLLAMNETQTKSTSENFVEEKGHNRGPASVEDTVILSDQYLLLGEVVERNKNLLDNNGRVIGEIEVSNDTKYMEVWSLEGVKYFVKENGKIVSLNPDKKELNVGYKL